MVHGFGKYGKPAATTVCLWDGSAALHADLKATQVALAAGRVDLTDLHARVRTTNDSGSMLRWLEALLVRAQHKPNCCL